MTDILRRESDRLAVAACRQTREDAVSLLASITDGEESYFDRPSVGPDVDVTTEQARFLQAVIQRMDVILAAFLPRGAA